MGKSAVFTNVFTKTVAMILITGLLATGFCADQIQAKSGEAAKKATGAANLSEVMPEKTDGSSKKATGAVNLSEDSSVKTGESTKKETQKKKSENKESQKKETEKKDSKKQETEKKESAPEYSVKDNKRELARRIWSTMSAFKQVKDEDGKVVPNEYYGLRGEQICALLGNWEQESGLDPTAVEAVMNEQWSIGATKKKAESNDFITEYDWGSEDIASYFKKHKNIYKAGIGLAQWTDTYTQVYDYSGYGLEEAEAALKESESSRDKEEAGFIAGSEDDDIADFDDDTDTGFIDIYIAEDGDLSKDISSVSGDDEDQDTGESSDDEKDTGNEETAENTGSDQERPKSKNVKPGRNTGLVEYAANTGSKFYPEDDKSKSVWDSDDRITSDASTQGKWCDPVVQLAYMLDRSKGGDARAAWLHSWAEAGEKVWHGDAGVNLEQLPDNELEGWTWREKAAFTTEHGWNPDLFYVADNKVSFTRENDTVRPVGDSTEDVVNFSEEDQNLAENNKTDNYYNTPNYGYVKEIEYDKWRWEDGSALSTSSKDWDRSQKDEHRDSGIYAARKLAFEYAQKSADLAWHGRLDGNHGTLGAEPEWNEYSKAGGHDFICENNAADIFIKENGIEKDGPYQHYGVIGDNMTKDAEGNVQHDYIYGWIMDKDPTQVANERAKAQYISTFKYIYRYHLYRYMTLYYTSQFLAEYEGVPGKALEERQKKALKWFQKWWDSGMEGNKGTGGAEPNVYSCEDPTVNKAGKSDHFFKVDTEYAQTIMKNLSD